MLRLSQTATVFALAAYLSLAGVGHAETGAEAWLRYAPVPNPARYSSLPSHIILTGDTPVDHAAANELQRGLSSMLGRRFTVESFRPAEDAIVLTDISALKRSFVVEQSGPAIEGDSFRIATRHNGSHTVVAVAGGTAQGELYAVFHLLELVASDRPLPTDERQSPSAPIRWVNEWDNMDGSIERGYAGRSIFFDNGHVRADLTRAGQYSRLLASVGINGCTVNNVNASLTMLSPETINEVARIADQFRPWGVRLSLSVDLSSPQTVGKLSTFDPLDPTVARWWQTKVDEIYKVIPDFAGFVVKADSEGRVGPSQYGRTPADAANVLARALTPHKGVVFYRGFVYNHHLDWNDKKADRARAGYDNFRALDGKFLPNVIIQVKHGPIDFQVREPVSPLFAALGHTSQAIELQTTQEYTGQQRHMIFLIPMWKWVLDTDLRAGGRSTPVKEIVEGKSFHQPTGGYISVVNVGLEEDWLHHPMALANLYGYGKLAWNPDLSSEQIIDSWTRLTFGNNPEVVSTISKLQLGSWQAYENYTGPLGIGTLTDILGVHFGPGIESAERNGWGQWFRGEKDGIGMDRSTATGTGYIGQYPPELAAKYESLKTCPDDLLLFLHHVPYDYKLHSGETVVQHTYDTHYVGAATAASYVPAWQRLHGLIDEQRHMQILALFTYQAGHAIVWRDAVNDWFHRISGIDDTRGRVGHHPNRIEAESMISDGYTSVDVDPWETASGGKAVVCKVAAGCTLTSKLTQAAGSYDVAIQYFDLRTGVSQFDLLVNGRSVATFAADASLPPAVVRPHLDGQTSTRFTAHNVSIHPGDTLELRGKPDLTVHASAPGQDADSRSPNIDRPDIDRHEVDRRELAPVDYIELGPNSPITPQ